MKQNVGPLDRLIRLGLGVALIYAAFTVSGGWVWVAGLLAAVAIVTAAAGFCPLYALSDINTNNRRIDARVTR